MSLTRKRLVMAAWMNSISQKQKSNELGLETHEPFVFGPGWGHGMLPRVKRSETRGGDLAINFAPDGAAETSHPGILSIHCDASGSVYFPVALAGRGRIHEDFHGLRGGGFAAAPLHPWLPSDAPFGAYIEFGSRSFIHA